MNILRHKLWLSKDTSSSIVEIDLMHATNAITLPQRLSLLKHTVTKSLVLVTNVTFPSDRLGNSNHTCESTAKKNLTHVTNVTTRQGSML